MKIEFVEVKWKNFLSYPNDFVSINLNSHKTTIITGMNGSGKSSILDVLSFTLYNKPFRDINKPELVNEINNRDCLVELTFIVGSKRYLVRRGIRPNIFEIFENGRLLNPKADSVDYQEILEKQIVRCSHRSFLQTVILGSGNYVPFMQLTTPQRREVIESLLDLKVFSVMQGVIKQGVAEIDTKMVDNRGEKVLLEREIDVIEQNQKLQDECNEIVIKKKEDVKTNLQEKINMGLTTIEVNQAGADLFLEVHGKIRAAEVAIKKRQSLKNELAARKRALDSHIFVIQNHAECPTCKQSIDEKFRDIVIDGWTSKCQEIEDATRILSEKIGELEVEREFQVKNEQERQAFLSAIRDQTFQVEQCIQQLKNLDEEIMVIRDKMNVSASKSDVKSLEKKITVLFKLYNQLENDRYQQSVALDLVPYIKAAVIKKYIPFFNKQILYYLQKFDSLIRFTLNEYFEETILYRGRDKLGYGSLSEGEKFRVNLAVLFAWRAVAKSRGSVDCNLLFLDEIMDSSLDAEGVESFMRIIRQLDDTTYVYVISHKDGDFVDSFNRIIEVKKNSNFSKIFVK